MFRGIKSVPDVVSWNITEEFFPWIKITRLKKISYLNPTEHAFAIGFQVLTKKSKFMAFLAEQAAKSRLWLNQLLLNVTKILNFQLH